uniref:endothelin-converting enzyme 2-like n=1 Tax=Myxine glutinosa TaxID=7769 RepID=UPI00358E0191
MFGIPESPIIVAVDTGASNCSDWNENSVKAAATILQNLDLTVEPCSDLYEYACGNWPRKNLPPEEKLHWNVHDVLWHENRKAIRYILETAVLNHDESEAERKAMRFYRGCVNESQLADRGVEPLQAFFKQMNLLTYSTSYTTQALTEILARNMMSLPLFRLRTSLTQRHCLISALHINQPELGLPSSDLYQNSTVLAAYQTYIHDVFMLLDTSYNRSIGEQILKVEKQLAGISLKTSEAEGKVEEISLLHLQKSSRVIDWEHLLNAMMSSTNASMYEPILTTSKSYLEKLDEVVASMSHIDLWYYMKWATLLKMSAALDRRFSTARIRLDAVIYGVKEALTPRWEYCLEETNGTFGPALQAIFARSKSSNTTCRMAESIVREINSSIYTHLDKHTFLNATTRRHIQNKLQNMSIKVGFPRRILKTSDIDDDFFGLGVASYSRFFDDVRDVLIFETQMLPAMLLTCVNHTPWPIVAQSAHIHYCPMKSTLYIPAGLLQSPFFSPDFPWYQNFGGFGSHIAYHLVKNVFPHDVSSGVPEECLKLPNKKVFSHGEVSKEDIIIGSITLQVTYNAYTNMMRSMREVNFLPVLGFPREQLFFISYLQSQCSMCLQALRGDGHNPARHRVNGTLAHTPAFSTAFNCRTGSPLLPTGTNTFCGLQ